MSPPTAARRVVVLAFVVSALAGCRTPEDGSDGSGGASEASPPPAFVEAPGFLYGRVSTYDGSVYEGRLRWGGGEEAFWGDYFNGVKDVNPWAAYTPLDEAAEERSGFFGIEFPWEEPRVDLSRPFMARFGDIARIEARGDGVRGMIEDRAEFDPDVRVVLKSGAVFDLDRLSASDFDDGVRVWDGERGVVDLGPREVRSIELLPTAPLAAAPDRLYGTVRTRQGEFTGFLQWDREAAVGRDRLVGRTSSGEVGLRFDAVRAIIRRPDGDSQVTLADGREVVLSGTRAVGSGNRGVYVDDPRYGRVLVSWDAFERVDFRPGSGGPGGTGPAYGDFLPGRPLTGRVTTRAGRRLDGRLVYDLDESETTETLDAPAGGVDYTVPFGLIASVALPESGGRGGAAATLTLRSGESLALERAGDLGDSNAGVLVFADGRESPEYVPWTDVERIDFDASPDAAARTEPRLEGS